MRLDAKVVLLPVWLLEVAKARGIPQRLLTDIKQLLEYFTKEDIISYLVVNKIFQQGLDEDDMELVYISKSLHPFDLIEYNEKLNLDDVKFIKLLQDIKNEVLINLNDSEVNHNLKLKELMFSKSYHTPQLPYEYYVKDLYSIDDNVYGLTFTMSEKSEAIRHKSLTDKVRMLHNTYPYVDVCHTPLFKEWCKSLQYDIPS